MTEPAAPEPPAAPPPGEAPPPPAARGPWRRRILLGAGVLVVLLAVGVALLPALLSSGYARGRMEAAASEAAGCRVSLAGLDVGWSRVAVEGLEVRSGPAAGDPVLLRVEAIRAGAGITLALGSAYDVGVIEIDGPEIRLDVKALRRMAEERRTAAKAAGPAPGSGDGATKAAGPGEPLPPFSAELRIRGGSLVLVGEDGRASPLGTFEATLAASRDGPATLVLEVALEGGGRTTLKIAATPFSGGRLVEREAMAADLSLALVSLDLSRLAALLALDLPLDRLEGVLEGSVTAKATGTGTVDGTVDLEARNLLLEGPALGEGRRVAEAAATVRGGFHADGGGAFELRDALVKVRGVEATVTLSLAPSPGGEERPRVNGVLHLRADLKALAERARDFGASPPGAIIGDLTADLRATGDDRGQRFTGNVILGDVQVSPGPGRAPLDEPRVEAEFDLVRAGAGFRIDALHVRSGALMLEASGSVAGIEEADLRVTAKAQTARLLALARAFVDTGTGELSGLADLEATWIAKGGPGRAAGTLTLKDVILFPPGEGKAPVREPLVTVAFDAAPGRESVEVTSLTVEAEHARLAVKGSAAADGSRGSLDLDAAGDLAPLLDGARGLGFSVPVEASGRVTFRGPVSWEGRGERVAAAGDVTARGLRVVLPASADSPARTLEEEEVTLAVDGVLERASDGKRSALTLTRGDLAADGLRASVAGRVAADGILDLAARGTAGIGEACRRAKAMGFLDRDPGTRGEIDFDLAVRGKPEAAAVTVTRLLARGAELDLDARGTLALEGPCDLILDAGGDLGALLDLAARAGFGERAEGAGGRVVLRLAATAATAKAPVRVEAEARVEDLRWPDPGGKEAWTQKRVGVAGTAVWDRDRERVEGDLALTSDDGGGTWKGFATLAPGERRLEGGGTFDLDLSGLTRSRPSLVPVEGMVVGRLAGKGTIRGPLREPFDLAALDGTAAVTLDSVKTRPFEVRDATVDAVLQGGTVRARSIAATVNDGAVKAEGWIALAGDRPAHRVEVHAEGVRIDPAMAVVLQQVIPLFALGETGLVSGLLKADLVLEGAGKDWEAVKPGLKGSGTLSVAEGSVSGSGFLSGILEVLGGARTLPFSSVTAAFSVHDGRVWNERLAVDGRDHAMVLKGSTTFDGRIDYDVGARALKMGKKKRERLARILDADGNLPFGIKGTLTRPKVKAPDLKTLLGNALEDLLKNPGGLFGGDDEEEEDGKGRKR